MRFLKENNMSPDKILVLVSGVGGIMFTFWFFFMKSTKVADLIGDSVDILVQGGYKPDRIKVPFGKTTKLIFDRRDSNPCLEEIVLPAFKIKRFLILKNKTEIVIRPDKRGEFDFSCGMGMYHGKLVVK